MKKIFTFFACLSLAFGGRGQSSFSDDFESYTTGANLAVTSPVWETWSGNLATEDAKVSTEQAHSGTKSVKFITTSANGGPSDVILPFGGAHESGKFLLDMWMYVVTGRGAYFNFQAEEATGQKWAADFFFDKDGKLDVNGNGNSVSLLADATYPVGAWFNLKVDVDITFNQWKVLIDNVVAGEFSNPLNKIASMDLFAYGPSGSLGNYYVDDVSYTYEPVVLPPLDAAFYEISGRKVGLTGQTLNLSGAIRNTGLNAITSFDVAVGSQTVNVSGVNVPSLGIYRFSQTLPVVLADGEQEVSMSLANVNGVNDDNPNNNSAKTTLRGYTPAPGRGVLVEEATGTWCPWCVRGTVYMDSLSHIYPDHFLGVAVHNDDPMMLDEYDAGLTSFPDFSGFPSVVVNRQLLADPSAMEIPFLEAVTVPTPVLLKNGAKLDLATAVLSVSVEANFVQNLNGGDYRIAAIVTEDGMTGTDTDWGQANAYAGGQNGVMGGYEALPSPVPASMMVYNHVGRALLGGFPGEGGIVPGTVSAGAEYVVNFATELENSNPDNLHIISILIGPDGEIVNASSSTLAEAIQNGFTTGTDDFTSVSSADIAPNPAAGHTFVRLNLKNSAETGIRIFDAMGRRVMDQQLGKLSGEQLLPISLAGLESGVYSVQIVAGDDTLCRKLVVNR